MYRGNTLRKDSRKHEDDYAGARKRQHNPYAAMDGRGLRPISPRETNCPKRNPLHDALLLSEFKGHIEKWKKETRHWSSLARILLHPSYMRIIALAGKIPHHEGAKLLLIELAEEPRHWFRALEAVTGENPVRPEYDFDQSVEAWLDYGESHGII
jgi:hypothetical protein